MFDDLPLNDGNTEENQSTQLDEQPSPLISADDTGWAKLWNRITSLGLGDIVLRAGTALVTIGLVGLVIWVMRGNFIGSEMVNSEITNSEGAGGAIDSGEIALPAYEGVAPIDGSGVNSALRAPINTAISPLLARRQVSYRSPSDNLEWITPTLPGKRSRKR